MVQVYADPYDSLCLTLAWDSPTGDNGAEILAYVLELSPSTRGWAEPLTNLTVTAQTAAEMTRTLGLGGSDYAAKVSLSKDKVTCGEPWAARVRSVNEMGMSPPEWYPTVVRIICCPLLVANGMLHNVEPSSRYPIVDSKDMGSMSPSCDRVGAPRMVMRRR